MQWVLKESAPDHYVQGQGIVKAGQEFTWEGEPFSEWFERLKGDFDPGDDEPIVEESETFVYDEAPGVTEAEPAQKRRGRPPKTAIGE